MKKLYGVYVAGEWEQNIGLRKAREKFQRWTERSMSRAEENQLINGQGLYVDCMIRFK